MNGVAPLLSVRDFSVDFRLPKKFLKPRLILKAVSGVSFDLMPGETLGVVGESGCGKSTLGRGILRLIPAAGGEVIWLGQPLTKISARDMRPLRAQMQIIFQDPLASLDPRMTIGDIIAEPLSVHRKDLPPRERRAKVEAIMDRVGLHPEMINRYPHEFSGGQAQRIGIARAMILEPRLIICDEPVSALDVSIQSQIINLLKRLQREFGLSLIFISHDLSVVRHISQRVMVLYLGKVVELADRDTIYGSARHPYTKALISASPLPDPRAERAKQRLVLTGDLPSPLNPPSGCHFRTRCPIAVEQCAVEAPTLASVSPDHLVSCHRKSEIQPDEKST
ncbi:MAG: ATP-binding cassette domain-containing protein [Azospirillaceae bacterium]|nr:ATP-binding cassette domain-containing protein [Azospirillaceae bacterium]